MGTGAADAAAVHDTAEFAVVTVDGRTTAVVPVVDAAL